VLITQQTQGVLPLQMTLKLVAPARHHNLNVQMELTMMETDALTTLGIQVAHLPKTTLNLEDLANHQAGLSLP
jgi:putative aminopeptidase FrvX